MKISKYLIYWLYLICAISGMTEVSAQEQSLPPPLISQLSQQIITSRVQWRRVITTRPKSVDPKLAAARVADYVSRHGGSPAQARGEAQLAAQSATRVLAGTTQQSILTFAHIGRATRCEVKDSASKLMTGAVNTDATAYDVDIMDDQKAISLSGYDNVGKMIGTAEKASADGLQHSAIRPGDLQFLIGTPIADIFSQSDIQANLKSTTNAPIVLHKAFGEDNADRIATMTVSRLYHYPIEMDETYPGEHMVRLRFMAYQFRKYSNNINFPSLIVITHYAIDGSIISDERYNLLSASFNQPLPYKKLYEINTGSSIRDTRFAIPVTYIISDSQLPSDQSILYVIQKYRMSLASQHKYAQERTQNGFILTIALIMGVAGLFLWFRRAKKFSMK